MMDGFLLAVICLMTGDVQKQDQQKYQEWKKKPETSYCQSTDFNYFYIQKKRNLSKRGKKDYSSE